MIKKGCFEIFVKLNTLICKIMFQSVDTPRCCLYHVRSEVAPQVPEWSCHIFLPDGYQLVKL
jgi:hypothetical protein